MTTKADPGARIPINFNLGGLGILAVDSQSFAGLFNSIKIALSFNRPRGSMQSKIAPNF